MRANFGLDLPEKKTLLDNEDVVVEISFEAENSNDIKYTLVVNRKDGVNEGNILLFGLKPKHKQK